MDAKCLVKAKTNFTMDLVPGKLADVREGVREQLDGLLLRYNEELEGVIMAYTNTVITGREAPVHNYFPVFRVQVKTEVTLFKPRVGAMLTGEVIKVGADYIGLLVLGVFNAAIGAQHIRQPLRCNLAGGCWRSPDGKHVISAGSTVRFHVTGVEDQGGILGIAGSLAEADTGEASFLAGGASTSAAAAAAAGGSAAAAGGGSKKDRSEKDKKKKENIEKDFKHKEKKKRARAKGDEAGKEEKGSKAQKQQQHAANGGGGGGGTSTSKAQATEQDEDRKKKKQKTEEEKKKGGSEASGAQASAASGSKKKEKKEKKEKKDKSK